MNTSTTPETEDLTAVVSNSHSYPHALNETQTLQLSLNLHASLDVDSLLIKFTEFTQALLPFDSLSYQHPAENIAYHSGEEAAYTSYHTLQEAEHYLGELCFTGQTPFSSSAEHLLKTAISALTAPLSNALRYHHAIKAAAEDPLTGIGNRKALENALHREIEVSKRYGFPLAILIIDIDRFKNINDRQGHVAGDIYLRAVTEALRHGIRESDWLFRIGGDEFVVLLSRTELTGTQQVAERLREAVSKLRVPYQAKTLKTTISLGIGLYQHSDTPQQLLEKADRALYAAKHAGRNQVHVTPSDLAKQHSD